MVWNRGQSPITPTTHAYTGHISCHNSFHRLTEITDRWLGRGTVRCFSIILLSLLALPFSFLGLCICFLANRISACYNLSIEHRDNSPGKSSKITVLVTGVGMAKGLTLARSFYLSGYRVIGADFEGPNNPCPGRYSRCLSVFFRLLKPDGNRGAEDYTSRLVDIIRMEDVKLWVSCSAVTNALEDAHAKESIENNTPCKCIQFDVHTTSTLHEKGSFMDECKRLGLLVPETHRVKSTRDVHRILSAYTCSRLEQRFILKPVGVDDVNRGNMTLLPLASEAETKEYVANLPISDTSPWILQQFIPGNEEYCTHALIVRGEVKCFVACPSTEMLMHYKSLPQGSPLWQAMLAFTVEFVRRSSRPESMTGHLSFDFMASSQVLDHWGFTKTIYAIECNPRAHTAIVLFGQDGLEMRDMVRAYLSVIETPPKDVMTSMGGIELPISTERTLVVPPTNAQLRYWIGHDITSLLYSIFLYGVGTIYPSLILSDILEFVTHLLLWKEGTFEIWDPLPAMILYLVYWPITILSAWWNGRNWSKVNVSTTKMFEC